MRGLKPYQTGSSGTKLVVAPYVGAWIETLVVRTATTSRPVAPYVGAWIETTVAEGRATIVTSHPTWVRGLKHNAAYTWKVLSVAPYVGAWIETRVYIAYVGSQLSRTLRGCVD